jgi:hypothetical protein
MKRNLLIILAALVLFFTSCKKDPANMTPLSADSYFPVTAGSTWRYFDIKQDGTTDTITRKATGATTVFNGKTYYNVSSKSTESGAGTEYYYAANHIFSMRALNAYAGTTVDLKLFNDTVSVGTNLISEPTDNGMIGNVPVRTISTVVEKNITKTVGGKTFNNVIHTQVDFQYDFSEGYGTSFIYDFFLAKGVGIIESQLTILGSVYEEEIILDYSVK